MHTLVAMDLEPKKPKKQDERERRRDERRPDDRSAPPAEVHIDHGERKGGPGREPEEPSGESEAV